MIKITKLDHVAICVKNIDEAAKTYRALFGLEVDQREVVGSQRTEAALLPLGDSNLELISPAEALTATGERLPPNEGLQRFLEKRGPGLHHIALEVEGIEAALTTLKSLGVPLIDETPRVGARGHKVAFVHPKATGGLLVELVEPMHE